jgi:hypothetical protein
MEICKFLCHKWYDCPQCKACLTNFENNTVHAFLQFKLLSISRLKDLNLVVQLPYYHNINLNKNVFVANFINSVCQNLNQRYLL